MLQQGVIIRAMDAYDFPDYIRVNVGLPEENQRFLEAFKKVMGL
jgi:histidinol-phosphate aminotransferase